MMITDKLRRILKAAPFFLAGVALIAWLSMQEENQILRSQASNPMNAPDLTLIQSTAIHYDNTGKKQYQLNAVKMDHFKESNMAFFEKPKLVQDNTTDQWHAEAEQGQADLNTDIIVLTNQVRIEKIDPTQNITLRTSELSIDTKQNIAENDVLTIIHSGKSYIESKGFHTNLNTSEILLKSNVRGTHDVQN